MDPRAQVALRTLKFSLEGLEDYLCPGIHDLGVICMCHKPDPPQAKDL